MNEKGIFWAFELGIGLLILSMAFHSAAITPASHARELAMQQCLDLQEMWLEGKEITPILSQFFPDKQISMSTTPIPAAAGNSVECQSTRERDGAMETQFIAIQW